VRDLEVFFEFGGFCFQISTTSDCRESGTEAIMKDAVIDAGRVEQVSNLLVGRDVPSKSSRLAEPFLVSGTRSVAHERPPLSHIEAGELFTDGRRVPVRREAFPPGSRDQAADGGRILAQMNKYGETAGNSWISIGLGSCSYKRRSESIVGLKSHVRQ
jgi:hypothetical protein